jgi:hypothetical protein
VSFRSPMHRTSSSHPKSKNKDAGGDQSPGVEPTGRSPIDRHLKISDLIEARERTDAGLRLAFPQLVESLTPSLPAPELETEDANAIGYRMGNGRAERIEATKVADVCGERVLQMGLTDLVNQIDELAGMLSVLAGLVEGRS